VFVFIFMIVKDLKFIGPPKSCPTQDKPQQ